MKKLSTWLLAAIVCSFIACQTTGSTAEGDSASSSPTAATSSDAAPSPTAPAPSATPAPAQPDHITQAEAAPKTTVEWASEEYNYGKVSSGSKVNYQFKFKNTGTQDLIITKVKPSCGCTTPSYSQEPVPPGEEGFIDVSFNTAGKSGIQNKSVTVTGNFEGNLNKVLRIKGEVEKAPTP